MVAMDALLLNLAIGALALAGTGLAVTGHDAMDSDATALVAETDDGADGQTGGQADGQAIGQIANRSGTTARTAADADAGAGADRRTGPRPATAIRSGDGLFYLTARINGESVRFAVDTGATAMVLTARDARRLHLPLAGRAAGRLRTAAGTTAMQWHRIDRMSVAGQQLGTMDAIVAPHGPTVSLLGLDALTRLGSITISNDRLTIG